MDELLKDIQDRFHGTGLHQQRREQWHLNVPRDQVLPLLSWLKSSTSFIQLTHYSVVDWLEDGEFEILWLVTDPVAKQMLIVSTRIERDDATMESVHHLWPQAVTYEQEINQMYGILFAGSPRQGVDFILEDWPFDPPMRRDFDTVAHVREHIPERPGRASIHTPSYIGEAVGQRRLLK